MKANRPFRMPEQPAKLRLTSSGRFLPQGLPAVKGPAARRLFKSLGPAKPPRDLYVAKPRPGPPSRPGGYPTAEE